MDKRKIYNILDKTRFGKKFIKLYTKIVYPKVHLRICLNQIGEREVVIWGKSEKAREFDKELSCRRNKRGCKYFVDDDPAGETLNGKVIISPEEILMDEQMAELCVVFLDYDNLMPKMERLFDMGLSRDQIVILERMGEYMIGCKKLNVYDVFLGYSRMDDLPGFTKLTGKQGADFPEYTIVTLGGSTTDPTFGNLRSWSEFLYRKLTNMGMHVTVFSGGVGGYNSTQELLKLIRDVIPMKPDLVISYSGTNNLPETENNFVKGFPFIRKYQEKIFQNAFKKMFC